MQKAAAGKEERKAPPRRRRADRTPPPLCWCQYCPCTSVLYRAAMGRNRKSFLKKGTPRGAKAADDARKPVGKIRKNGKPFPEKQKEPKQAEEAAKRCAACSFSFGSFDLFVLVSVPAGGKRPLTEYMHPCGVGFIKLCGALRKQRTASALFASPLEFFESLRKGKALRSVQFRRKACGFLQSFWLCHQGRSPTAMAFPKPPSRPSRRNRLRPCAEV